MTGLVLIFGHMWNRRIISVDNKIDFHAVMFNEDNTQCAIGQFQIGMFFDEPWKFSHKIQLIWTLLILTCVHPLLCVFFYTHRTYRICEITLLSFHNCQRPFLGSSWFGEMRRWKVSYQSVRNFNQFFFMTVNPHIILFFDKTLHTVFRQEDNFPSDITKSGQFHNLLGIETLNNIVKGTIGFTTAKLGTFFLHRGWFGPWEEGLIPFIPVAYFHYIHFLYLSSSLSMTGTVEST